MRKIDFYYWSQPKKLWDKGSLIVAPGHVYKLRTFKSLKQTSDAGGMVKFLKVVLNGIRIIYIYTRKRVVVANNNYVK